MQEMDEIDRILSEDEVIRPTTGFSTRVMRAVREEAASPAPLGFPWARFLPGLITSLALILAGFVALSWTATPEAAPSPDISMAAWLAEPTVRGLLWAAVALFGSGVLAWAATRLGPRQRTPGF